MKPLLPLMLLVACAIGCTTEHEIQADMEAATLIKADVIRRTTGTEKIYTWKTENGITYVTFEPYYVDIPIGTIARVLIKK